MGIWPQVVTIVKKNMVVSIRNKEFLIEALLPIIVALMLALKKQLAALSQLMPLLYSLAITSPQRSILIHLVEEKSKRFKEVQKIMGMNERAYTFGWMLTGYIRITISMLVFEFSFYILNEICGTEWNEFFRVGYFELMWPYIVFGFAAMNQIFLISSIFNDVKIAGEIQSFIGVAMNFFIYFTFVEWAAESKIYYIVLSTISPQCGAAFSYVSAMKINANETDMLKINLFPVDIINATFSTNMAGILLCILFILYLVLFAYFEQVIPNEYGIAKHPLFFLKPKQYKKIINEETISNLLDSESKDLSSALYHEELNMNSLPSILIHQLSKLFGDFKAVDNLSLSLYESQIFCLLGHNGAGKTTAINLLTGMIQKTSGQVQMYGMNLDNELECIRKSLGLCNQKDCLYSELTVYEHLKFISGIKGQIDNEEINEIMIKTDLQEECHKQVSQLSGGSKRKLSLAMALVGNSKIIFLDEPTSGMDAFSRRQIWEILERIKADKRTIILTTHHLDEAEILADRIGIMSKGQLLAVGTSEFIKRKFGEGYNLTLTLVNPIQKNEVVKQVKLEIQNAQFDSEHSMETQLIFTIPFSQQYKLGSLFQKFEEQKIKIGLKMNTLEDAFIRIGMEDDENDDNKVQSQNIDFTPKCLSKSPQYNFPQQVIAIFLRRLYTVIRTSTNYFAIFIPITTFILGIATVASIKLENLFKDQPNMEVAIEFFKVSLLSSCNVLGFCFNATIYITLPVQEKEYYLKQALQGMGCRSLPYWLGTFLFDFIIFSFFIGLFFGFSAAIGLTIALKYWKVGLLSFLCFGQSQILMAYIMGFLFKKVETALKLYAIFCFFAQFCFPFVLIGFLDYFYQQFDHSTTFKYLIYAVQIIFAALSPFYAYFEAYTFISGQFGSIGNSYETPQISSDSYVYCYIMLAQGIVQCIILYFLEKKSFSTQRFVKKASKVDLIDDIEIESSVLSERQRILKLENDDPIQAIELEKEYIQGQPTLQKITFGVNQSEIFGIIGPNGAGKSTLINSFTGIIQPSNGSALIQGYEPKQQNMAVMQHVGICPQFDCIWENLTPVEHLQLFGRIKGLVGNDLNTAVTYFIETMQLGLFVKTKAGQLSGGNKRKLCVADALIGGSDITFFDEPSTGVDPISRRFLFSTLKRNVQLRNCSAVMTTHTIEEAESLSDRIGILIAGQFKCLGSPEQLRKKYGSGYQITIKCKANALQDQLESMVKDNFNDSKRIEDKRANHMTFSLSNENFSFYKAFNFFDQIKQDDLISDFQINESSLEQVFIHFSRIQQEINEKAGVLFD